MKIMEMDYVSCKKRTKILVSKELCIYINNDEFVSVNNLIREYNEMNEEIKNRLQYTT